MTIRKGGSPDDGGNRRNGHTKKTIRSEYEELELEISHDREEVEFESDMMKKCQKDVPGIEKQILALYAKSVTVREIQANLNQLYGIEVSPMLISNVTNRIIPMIREWQA